MPEGAPDGERSAPVLSPHVEEGCVSTHARQIAGEDPCRYGKAGALIEEGNGGGQPSGGLDRADRGSRRVAALPIVERVRDDLVDLSRVQIHDPSRQAHRTNLDRAGDGTEHDVLHVLLIAESE